MKLLHLANGNLFGGIETFLVTLARLEHAGKGQRNFFLLSHEGRLAAELRFAGASVQVLSGARIRNPWAVRRVRAQCRQQAEEQRPDLVVAHGPWAYYVFGHAFSDGRVPIVFWQHGLAHRDLLHLLAGRSLPAAVIANSAVTARTTPRVFAGVPTHVVRYPVQVLERRRSREAVRRELGAGDDVIVLQTSRFERWKGHELLLSALLQLPDLPWQLWLAGGQTRAGERRLRAKLEALATRKRSQSRVKFLGERRDIPDVLGAADVFCQPNTGREPYGLAPVEALGAGLPIVVTEAGATALEVSPEWGRLVPISSDALARALSELIRDPVLRGRMGEQAQAHHRDRFSTERTLAEMNEALRSIAELGA